MSYLDHIRHCNNADPAGYRPMRIGGATVGHVRHDLAQRLAAWPDVFQMGAAAIDLHPRLDSVDARSDAVEGVLGQLNEEGLILGWRGETYPVAPRWGAEPLMRIERAACPLLGIRAWGVHMNGYVRRADGIHMWIGRRAKDKPTYPGMLDNMVAGGQPLGLGLRENLIKEAGEEANIPPALAARATAVGAISYRHALADGLKPDEMFCFDLELPEGFVPRNTDGEIESFRLMPVAEVARIVRDTAEFKFNCNLVIIDFLIRHGLLDPDAEPDYGALCAGLHAG
ncbi:MAG: DUF4743 domain-containing protein [Alphaproteobacteria bacterium]